MIPVTKPFMPPLSEYNRIIQEIWNREILTNNGPCARELEERLNKILNIQSLSFVANGTLAIQIAIKALKLSGEVITTPFSYIATTSSLLWEGLQPVFVDIDPYTLNIDTTKIESHITEKTSAILATHVYGNPCNVDHIKKIAEKYNLKVIYDAAHCFGTRYEDKSILSYGDVSTISFHATKLFHTIEGGGIVTNSSDDLSKIVKLMRNFGHNGPDRFDAIGINGKNSEFHAAMGLINTKYVTDILDSRKKQYLYYKENLESLPIRWIRISKKATFNYAYSPLIFENEKTVLDLQKILELKGVFTRRYFYPSLSSLEFVSPQKTPKSDDISRRVLCLPLFYSLKEKEQDVIIGTIKKYFF